MPTAPTLVAAHVGSVDPGGGAAGSVTTSSLVCAVGDVVVVMGVSEGGNTSSLFSAPTTTLSNGGITQLQNHAVTSDTGAGAWTFTVTAGTTTGTVTTNFPSTPNGEQITGHVFVYRNGVQPTVARSALGTGSARTASYTPSQANSAICWVVGDWSAAAVTAQTPTSSTHGVAAPGPTALPSNASVASIYTHYGAVLDDQASTGATAYGITGTGTGPFVIVIVEVQGSGGVAGPTPPPELIMANRRSN